MSRKACHGPETQNWFDAPGGDCGGGNGSHCEPAQWLPSRYVVAPTRRRPTIGLRWLRINAKSSLPAEVALELTGELGPERSWRFQWNRWRRRPTSSSLRGSSGRFFSESSLGFPSPRRIKGLFANNSGWRSIWNCGHWQSESTTLSLSRSRRRKRPIIALTDLLPRRANLQRGYMSVRPRLYSVAQPKFWTSSRFGLSGNMTSSFLVSYSNY